MNRAFLIIFLFLISLVGVFAEDCSIDDPNCLESEYSDWVDNLLTDWTADLTSEIFSPELITKTEGKIVKEIELNENSEEGVNTITSLFVKLIMFIFFVRGTYAIYLSGKLKDKDGAEYQELKQKIDTEYKNLFFGVGLFLVVGVAFELFELLMPFIANFLIGIFGFNNGITFIDIFAPSGEGDLFTAVLRLVIIVGLGLFLAITYIVSVLKLFAYPLFMLFAYGLTREDKEWAKSSFKYLIGIYLFNQILFFSLAMLIAILGWTTDLSLKSKLVITFIAMTILIILIIIAVFLTFGKIIAKYLARLIVIPITRAINKAFRGVARTLNKK